MTIAILKLSPGQKIARPMNRACSVDEATEILRHWEKHNPGSTSRLLRVAKNLDTDKPVFEHAGCKFYAFTEE